jgi:hypothetical protein
MTRAQIEESFSIENGRITSPGKFEGQRLYVPYFWGKVLEGWQDDEDEDGTPVFFIDASDRAEFPEIHTKVKQIRLIEQESGFIIER